MSYIGQAPGLGQRVPYRFVATAGQTSFSGPDANGYPLGYTPGLVDIYLNGRLLSEPDVTATDGSSIVLASGLSVGDELRVLAQAPFSPANTYTMGQADALYTKRRNRITDPGMRVSQEQGNNLITLVSGTAYYPSDSIVAFRSGSTGAATAQRVALVTPGGSQYRNRFTVTTSNAAPAVGDYAIFGTRIEGLDVADLRFGSTSAHTIVVRFGCRSSVAGAFPVAIQNAANNRTFLGSVVIAAGEVGTDALKTVTLTGDTTGTWATDNTVGLHLYIGLQIGTTFQGVAGWQAGNYLGLAAGTNLMATNGATFDLFDVGLYDVTGLQGGVIPPFELESFDKDYLKCLRYFEVGTFYALGAGYGANNYVSTTQSFMVIKRTGPSMTVTPGSTLSNVFSNSTAIAALTTGQFNAFFQTGAQGNASWVGQYNAYARL